MRGRTGRVGGDGEGEGGSATAPLEVHVDSESPAEIEVVGECTDSFQVRELTDGSSEIVMRFPARFRGLVLEKLRGLRVSEEEFFSCMPHHARGGSRAKVLRTPSVADVDRQMTPRGQLNLLRGRGLTSVQFVHDYLQLHFDEMRLTVNAPLSISDVGGELAPRSSGWCEALLGCIGACVVEIAIETGVSVGVVMDNGCRLSVSLRSADQVGPEPAVFDSGNGVGIVLS